MDGGRRGSVFAVISTGCLFQSQFLVSFPAHKLCRQESLPRAPCVVFFASPGSEKLGFLSFLSFFWGFFPFLFLTYKKKKKFSEFKVGVSGEQAPETQGNWTELKSITGEQSQRLQSMPSDSPVTAIPRLSQLWAMAICQSWESESPTHPDGSR